MEEEMGWINHYQQSQSKVNELRRDGAQSRQTQRFQGLDHANLAPYNTVHLNSNVFCLLYKISTFNNHIFSAFHFEIWLKKSILSGSTLSFAMKNYLENVNTK